MVNNNNGEYIMHTNHTNNTNHNHNDNTNNDNNDNNDNDAVELPRRGGLHGAGRGHRG